MDSRQVTELLKAMEGAGPTWTWSLHPRADDLNGAAYDADVVGSQVSAFIFRRIVDSWERGERPATIIVKVEVNGSDLLSITCPKCQRTSFNPNDVCYGYCGACHEYTSPRDATRLVEANRPDRHRKE